ncbi:unnamed protein product [Periconia digitata]|uniref:DNA-directed RNA polymerase I subunit RPA43 n=1 Tax=Periconia digitata TaxID=1303443 RepID=A0A9W4XJQ9_9PLEO|nr:unnamed protein product [Periconia digitata]
MVPIKPSSEASLFHRERVSQYVSLPAASLTSALPSICANVFSPLLLTYHPPVRGVVLAYTDVSLSSSQPTLSSTSSSRKKSRHNTASHQEALQEEHNENGTTVLLTHIDEYTSPFLWATATLLVWRPSQNARIPATITHQSSTHMTLSYLNLFAVTVLRAHMPENWSWHAEGANKKRKGWDGRVEDLGGWWVDGDGVKVGGEEGEKKELSVRVTEWDARPGVGKGRGFLKIEGSLLEESEEARETA